MDNQQKLFQDPYSFYFEQRANDNLKFFTMNEDYNSEGFWGVFRYNQALDILKNIISTSKNFSVLKNENNKSIYDLHLLNRDGGDHARLRKLSLKFFSASSLSKFDHVIEDVIDARMSIVLKNPNIDLINDFARKVPIQVILKLIGIKSNNADEIASWINDILIDSLLLDANLKIKRKSAVDSFILFVSDLIKSESDYEIDSLIYHLIFSCREEKLSQDELISYLIFLMVAGHETTIDLMGNSLYTLLCNKKFSTELKKNPDLIISFIEEVLRLESPVQRTTFRVLNNNTTIAGTNLKEGEQVRIFIGSVNRDESIFPMSETFLLDRNPNPHLAFGFGPHNCIGQYLARVETKIAILKILPFISNFLLLGEPSWKFSNFSRGLESLSIKNLN